MREFKILLPILLLFFSLESMGQEVIVLENPSFEGVPGAGEAAGKLPLPGWYDCGFVRETAPDIHTSLEKGGGFFNVQQKAFDGNTYLGLVVRDNDTWERVTQRLSVPMEAGVCYEFSISLSRSLTYESPGRTTGEMANYATPAKLRIWGGAGQCDRAEKLAESSLVINSRWLEYNFRFEPTKEHRYIILEAFYKTPTPFPYNGNILLDNASAIIPVPCDIKEPELPAEEAIVDLPVKVNGPGPKPPVKTRLDPEPKKEPKILKNLAREKLRVGETIRMDQLYFPSDSSSITPPSLPVLNEVFVFLSENPDVVVEIGGHTNGIPPHDYCDRLSTARAKSVADYLIKKGIPRERLQYKGYGKRKPVDTNKSSFGRKRNQRVEIKILSFDG